MPGIFRVRLKEDTSEIFEVYNVRLFKAQNKQGYDIRFLIFDGCYRYVTADVFEPADAWDNDGEEIKEI